VINRRLFLAPALPIDTMHWDEDADVKKLLLTLDIGSHINAGRQLLPEAGALAQAVGSQLHAVVRGLGGYAATHAQGTGTARAFRAILAGQPGVVVTVPALVPRARW
jgi:hypothetical protein